ncbi:PIN domain-containing protein [Aliihoeflea sp. 2WW]|uniref:type II toxin-antitoxin system VapC family toxin n=1 Tax=Aliihoeflea sp. 2WW TaxID=1381123 RepID=UPI0004679553|nr:PIN domain-containing protein [Aliihoeflea sp. 2WW]
MASIERLYLDTNVFVAMAEGADDLSSELYGLVGTQRPGQAFLCTSELSLAELLVQPYRDENDGLIQLYDNWINSGAWLEVRPVDRGVLWYAAVVRQQFRSVKLPDAIHISTAIGLGCTHFISGDRRLPSEINLYHKRWGTERGPAKLAVLPLDLDTVTRIRGEFS